MTYENIEPFSSAELAENRVKALEPGYPPLEAKLVIPASDWERMVWTGGIIISDDGPWHILNHPNRQKAQKGSRDPRASVNHPMPGKYVRHWQELGLLVDTAGRPLHPRASQLLTTLGVGMYTGPGFHYRYGPQRMGNLGLRRERHGIVEYAMSAVRRSTLKWGLPGGYANANETVEDAAFRKAFEEVGVKRAALGALSVREAILSPPKGFKRDTLHAWGEEWFTFAHSRHDPGLDGVTLAPLDAEEVVDVAWVSTDEVRLSLKDKSKYDIIGTHAKMILQNEERLR